MSAAFTHQVNHTHSGGCSSGDQSSSSSSCRSRHQSPVSPTSHSHDHHMTSPRQSASAATATLPSSSLGTMSQASREAATVAGQSSDHTASSSDIQTQLQRAHSRAQDMMQRQAAAPQSTSALSTAQLASGSSTSPRQHQVRLPTAAQRRRARELATVLLTLATCQGCLRPVQDPVTLPCGHSSCLQCIKDIVLPKSIPSEDEVRPLPCLSHLPPRLPLSPMTVPCPAQGCPRSAIGRGIGVWAGHQPRYGLIPTYTERLPQGPEDVGPGAPPVDGFVMGVADHPLRLTVIGPQTRSKAHLFAVPPQGVEPNNGNANHQTATTLLPSLATSNMLRTDVTLSKAVTILMRYASSPLPRPPRQRRSLPGFSGPSSGSSSRSRQSTRRASASRGTTSHRASAALGLSARARAGARSHRSSHGRQATRGQGLASTSARRSRRQGMPQAGMGIFGQNESELESGTVGGVRAAGSDSDDDTASGSNGDSSTGTAPASSPYRGLPRGIAAYDEDERGGWTVHDAADLDGSDEEDSDRFWPDRVGGAYSRPPISSNAGRRRGKAHLKRRRGRLSNDSNSGGNSSTRVDASRGDAKVAKAGLAEASEQATTRHVDSGWSTEDSTAGNALHRANDREALVDAVRRRRAAQAHSAASTASDADTDIDSQRQAVEAKHSLALSSRVGVHGEPLIQSVATLHSELVEVLECQLCYLLLYDPLTTPCGHTFCKSCFARSLDHGDRCPLCRADMPNFSFFQDHRPNTALLKILTSDTATFSDDDGIDSDSGQEATSTYAGISIALGSGKDSIGSVGGARRAGVIVDDDPETAPHHYGFKRLYEQRKAVIEQEEREARLSTPIFVCTLAFPGMPTILHIFEPRYRLMVRRCLESGNPRFGMVLPSRTNGGTEEYGTMLEIKSVQMLADGRSMLETVGSYRFRLLEKGSLDGYTVGRVERVDDISLEEEAELERAVLVRRTELERKKAAEAVERPRACPMAPSSSAPAHPQASSGEEGTQTSDAASTRPEMSRAESDALSIYRTGSSTEASSGPPSQGQSAEASGAVGSSPSGVDTEEREPGRDADEAGLLPFKPVPAEPSIEELTEICTTFIETLRSGSAPWLLSRLNHTYGPMPSADEVERLGYWMALVMPIDEHEKAKLLPIRSRRLRLCLVVHWIEQLRQSWWFNSGCTVS